MKKKANKLRKIFLIILIIIICLNIKTRVFALINAFDSADNFVNQGQSNLINYTALDNVFHSIYNFFFTVAVVIAVVGGFYLAGKMLTHSIDDKVDTQRMIFEYVKNIVLLALIPTAIGIILKIVGSII